MRLPAPRAAAAASGVLLFLAAAVPPLAPLSFVALVPWLGTLAAPRSAARSGWVLGLVFWGLNLSWCLALVPRIGAVWPAAAWFGQVLVLAALTAGAGWTIASLAVRLPLALAAPLGWLAVEWGRGSLLGPLNFPWSPVALPLVHLVWWAHPAAWVGGWGIGLGVVLVNGLLATALREGVPDPRRHATPGVVPRRWTGAAGAALTVLVLWGALGAWRARSLESRVVARVGVVQPGIELNPARPDPEADSLALAALALVPEGVEARMVVLPETLFPARDGDAAPGAPRWSAGAGAALRATADRAGVPLLTGAYGSGSGGDTNAAFLIRPPGDTPAGTGTRPPSTGTGQASGLDGVGLLHEKHALVPGVEWTPYGGLERGPSWSADPVTGLDPAIPGVLICIESAWSGLARRHAQRGALWLVNITNDAWLSGPGWGGLGFAFRQHPAHLQLRSLETGLGAVRAGTTGLSGVTDPAGGWTPILEPHAAGFAVAEVRSLGGPTLYATGGWWLAPALSILTLMAVVAGQRGQGRGPVDHD